MLDPQHRDPAVAQARHRLDECGGLGVGKSATDLIEKKDRRFDGQRPSQLEAFALQQAQAFRAPVGKVGQPRLVQHLQAEVIRFRAAPLSPGGCADEHVLEDAHPHKGSRHLVGSGDAQLAAVGGPAEGDVSPAEIDGARVGCKRP